MIEASVYGTLRDGSISCTDAPIQYDEMDREGREQLEKYVDAIGATEGVPLDLETQQLFELQLDVDYVWLANLVLNKIDEIVPGDEQGDTSTVWGDWTLELKLVNVQFNETAGEATVSWNGLAGGWTSAGWESGSKENAIKNMVREEFLPITQVIYGYERIPRSADPRPERTVIGNGDEMVIGVAKILDHQGRVSRRWQRVVVEVKEGELLNGTPLESAGEARRYAFTVGDGTLQLKYKSPEECETKTETVKVYNSCTRGRSPAPVRMEATDPAQEIGSTEFEILCAEGKIEFKEVFKGWADAETTCTYERPVDTVTFQLVPTNDPCLFNLKGSTSEVSVRKTYCHKVWGTPVNNCPKHERKTWEEYERQSRLTGGTVDFRDKSRPPISPVIERRQKPIRYDVWSLLGCGSEHFSQGSLNWPKQALDWQALYRGYPAELRGFPIQDGYVDDLMAPNGDGFYYTLRIDEEPFHRLEQSCLDAMEMEGMKNSVPGQGDNK